MNYPPYKNLLHLYLLITGKTAFIAAVHFGREDGKITSDYCLQQSKQMSDYSISQGFSHCLFLLAFKSFTDIKKYN